MQAFYFVSSTWSQNSQMPDALEPERLPETRISRRPSTWTSSLVSWRCLGGGLFGRPTSGNASRPTHRHRIWSSFPVHRIGSLLHCRHPSAERRTPRYLARNMEHDVRDRTPGPVAGCRCGSAAGASDERPLPEHSDRVPARRVCNVGLPGIKPGWEFGFSPRFSFLPKW